MKAYIQTDKDGEFYNVNVFIANEGFKHFGYEVIKYMEQQEKNCRENGLFERQQMQTMPQ